MINPTLLAEGIGDYFVWWQIPMVLLLIVVIVAYVIYRRKQM